MSRTWTPETAWATFSPCGRYRYTLGRKLRPEPGPSIAFIGLNPSTADATQDDPTVRRCWRFAERWGYHEFVMLNLFAFRATDPDVMKRQDDPVGYRNDGVLMAYSYLSSATVFAWGVHGAYRDRAAHVVKMLVTLGCHPIFHLGRTKDGHPRHPLYLPNSTQLEEWA